jgi:DNA-binding beta-propeller fold protein YncE
VILTSIVVAVVVGRGTGEEQRTGRIQVNSNPAEATVYLDGVHTGRTTNCLLSNVAAGSHTITLVKEGYMERGRSSLGSIQVFSEPPMAHVFLDGEDTGQNTNCTLSDVSPGVHTIRIVKEGYLDEEESVRVTAGQTEAVNVTLEPHTISVINPTRETVWIVGDWEKVNWTTGESNSIMSNSIVDLGSIARSNRTWLFSPSHFKQVMKGPCSTFRKRGKGGTSFLDLRSGAGNRAKSIGKGKRKKNQNFPDLDPHFPEIAVSSQSPLNSFRFVYKSPVNIQTIANVKIDLYKGSDRVETIAENTLNLGEYLWTVPEHLERGEDYKVRVSCPLEGSIFGESENFTISFAFEFFTAWGSQGSGDGQFNNQRGIAVDSSGFIYVADFNNHRIQKFNSEGTFITKWGSYGQEDGLFDNPWGIAVNSSGDVYVADYENHRIQRFSSEGAFLDEWGEYGAAA